MILYQGHRRETPRLSILQLTDAGLAEGQSGVVREVRCDRQRDQRSQGNARGGIHVGSEAMSFGRDARLIITMQHPQSRLTHTPLAQGVGGKELCPPLNRRVDSKNGTRGQASPANC